jgi:Mg2+/Co2+ transporter CorB
LVTLEDIVEEIVGDIKDEHDELASGVRQRRDGTYVVDGSVPVRDLNRSLAWGLPEEEATTIAGLVIHEARTIPDIGQVFNFHGFRFEILKKRRQQVTSIGVTPPPPSQPPSA